MAILSQITYETLPAPKLLTLFVSGSADASRMKDYITQLINNRINIYTRSHFGLQFDVWISELRLEGGISRQTVEMRDAYIQPLRDSHFVVFVVHTHVGPGTRDEASEICKMVEQGHMTRDFLYAYINSRSEMDVSVTDFEQIIREKVFWRPYDVDPGSGGIEGFKIVVAETLPTWLYQQLEKIPLKPYNASQLSYLEETERKNRATG